MDLHVLVNAFLTISDDELPNWIYANQENISVEFFEKVRSIAEEANVTGDLSQALRHLNRAELAGNLLDMPLGTAVVWKGRANCYQRNDQFELSLKASDQAINIYNQHNLPLDAAKASAVKIFVLGQQVRFDEANELANKILPIFRARNFTLGEAVVTVNLGRVFMKGWEYKKARPRLNQALKLYQELGADYQRQAGVILQDLGVVTEQLDELDASESYLKRAYPLLLEANDIRACAKKNYNHAQLCLRQERLSEALNYIDEARQFLVDLPLSEDHAITDLFEARIRLLLGERAKALSLLETSLKLFDSLDSNIERLDVLLELAQTLAVRPRGNELHQAIAYLDQVEALLTDLDMPLFLGYVRWQKGEFYLQLNRLADAAELAKSAKNIFSDYHLPFRQAQVNVLLADSWQFLYPNQAKELYGSIIEEINERVPLLSARCWQGLGKIALNNGDYISAVEAMEKAVDLLDGVRFTLSTHLHRAGFLDNKQMLFEDLLTALFSQESTKDNYTKRLIHWIERLKSQALAELLPEQSLDNTNDEQFKSLLAKREEYRKQIDYHQSAIYLTGAGNKSLLNHQRTIILNHDQSQLNQLEVNRKKLEKIEELIAKQQNIAYQWHKGINNDSLNVHSIIDKDTLLISYFSVKNRLHAFTATSTIGDIRTFQLNTNSQEIGRLWQQASRWILRPSDKIQEANSRSAILWQKLFKPLQDHMAAKKRLLILPTRGLYQIPFAALYDKNNGCYLIERWQLQIAPSATILNWCQQRPMNNGSPLFVGYPGEPGQPNYLKNVLLETEQLANIFPSSKTFLKHNATKLNVLSNMANRSIIHLAGHMIYDPKHPLESGMPLADQLWLRASDLYMKYGQIDGSVVTMSGCSSAKGCAMGRDVLGLTSACLYAGATAVIAGLWEVNDESTALLMQDFYSHIKEGETMTAALRNAQVNLMKNQSFENPYYWSPFQLNGDNRTIGNIF